MIGTPEMKGTPQTPPLFRDWAPYNASVISPQLPGNIRYAPPHANEPLRMKITKREAVLSETDRTLIGICATFLEAGSMVDDFGKDDTSRDTLLKSGLVVVDGKTMPLLDFSKIASKLSGTAITRIITASQLVGSPTLAERSFKVNELLQQIKKEKGFYEIGDLAEVDTLAMDIIDHILQSKG